MRLVAKTLMGLEEILANELKELGAEKINIGNRVVEFEGKESLLYKTCYNARTAIRILWPIYKFRFRSKKDYFNKIFRFNWEKHFEPHRTIAIDSVVHSRFFNHDQYVSQLTKDGIADYFVKKVGTRPNVELNRPDIRIHVHIQEEFVEVSLDASGYSMHKRSYRTESVYAPLNEILAAGMVQLSGWDKKTSFIDPMCGSGTLAIEAAMFARNIPSQYLHETFSFQCWKSYNAELYNQVRKDSDAQIIALEAKIYASDRQFRAIQSAKTNALNILDESDIDFSKQDFFSYEKMENYLLIMNPPYDLRLKNEDIEAFYSQIGDHLKKEWKNSIAWILSGNISAIKSIGLKTSRKIHLMNGQIPSKFHKFEMYAGTRKHK